MVQSSHWKLCYLSGQGLRIVDDNVKGIDLRPNIADIDRCRCVMTSSVLVGDY
jgi:hypothetical protein